MIPTVVVQKENAVIAGRDATGFVQFFILEFAHHLETRTRLVCDFGWNGRLASSQ
jgi:hypothetical protein